MATQNINPQACVEPLNSAACFGDADKGDTFPLSPAQEGLWILDRISPGSAAYNMPEAWRYRGILDQSALQMSLAEIVNRHEILRTTFSEQEGRPMQLIRPSQPFELQVVDLTTVAAPEAELSREMNVEARRPFDLKEGPLLRVRLFRLKVDEHVLLVNMHHIISDAWSFGVFFRELAANYRAFRKSEPSPLSELPVQFADYAVWQRGILQGDLLQESIAYWQKQLAGHDGFLPLPADRPRSAVRSDNGITEFFHFPKELSEKLKVLARKLNATLYMTLLTAFKIALHRYTGLVDIIVGSPFSRRDRSEIEGLIGYFVHTHALRTNLSGNPRFLEALGRVKESTLGAHRHQEITFETIVNALKPERNPNQHPIFQVVFGLQNSFMEDCALAGLESSRVELETGTSKFDWTLLMTETTRDLSLRFEYNCDLFDRTTIVRFTRHFERLLEEIVRDPERKLSEFSMFDASEERQLLIEWNSTATEYEREMSIPEMFERQVKCHPGSIALTFDDREMSYDELNARADELARRLGSLGVGPGVPVGLCLDRSFDLVIGMLGILKAGGVYVPLDASYPIERLRFMIKDTGIGLLLTDKKVDFEQARIPGVQILGTDCGSLANSQGEAVKRVPPTAQQGAYIMYTSGSTGTPKATLIPHRAVLRLVRNTNYIQISQDDVFLQFAPITFDASTFEIWGALLNGGKLTICPPGLLSFEELGRVIEREKVSILWLTAGLFHQMVEDQIARLRGLRFLLAGGDTLSVSHVLKAKKELKGCRIINGYGPTENTTFSCCFRVPDDWEGASSVPIGRPISNSQAYILDAYLNPAPIGVSGELYVGGDGLGNGYLNRPDFTAERFIQSPFEINGERKCLYRTGDLARWLADGNIEFLGRADEQIKIRGFRVEPGEIAAALKQHAGVDEALVMAEGGKGRPKVLVAYIVARNGILPGAEALRAHAESKLPSYMVPARYFFLDQFPLTANGKIDRRALPKSNDEPSDAGQSLHRPKTHDEVQMARIWEELLERKEIGIRDDFFHLGGNSLLAMQVISRIAKSFQIEVPVRMLFEGPTIAAMVAAVEECRSRPASPPLIQRMPRDRAAELLARLDTLSETELESLLADTELETLS